MGDRPATRLQDRPWFANPSKGHGRRGEDYIKTYAMNLNQMPDGEVMLQYSKNYGKMGHTRQPVKEHWSIAEIYDSYGKQNPTIKQDYDDKKDHAKREEVEQHTERITKPPEVVTGSTRQPNKEHWPVEAPSSNHGKQEPAIKQDSAIKEVPGNHEKVGQPVDHTTKLTDVEIYYGLKLPENKEDDSFKHHGKAGVNNNYGTMHLAKRLTQQARHFAKQMKFTGPNELKDDTYTETFDSKFDKSVIWKVTYNMKATEEEAVTMEKQVRTMGQPPSFPDKITNNQ